MPFAKETTFLSPSVRADSRQQSRGIQPGMWPSENLTDLEKKTQVLRLLFGRPLLQPAQELVQRWTNHRKHRIVPLHQRYLGEQLQSNSERGHRIAIERQTSTH